MPIDEANKEPVVANVNILDLLHSSGNSRLYRAKQLTLDRIVVVKVLSAQRTPDEAARKRFTQEAQLAGSLQHPNIVQLLGSGLTSDGEFYLLMEYVEGKTLAQFIKEHAPFCFRVFRDVFIPLLEAIDYAHEKNILHRDIKPENIMICISDEGATIPKLLDFGIAKFLSSETQSNTNRLTQTAFSAGTPMYMSPEQCMGKELDRRSDLYSMACTMYEFLTMAPPFPSENIFDTIYSRVHGKRPATQELCAWQIPEALAKLILQALNKEPDSRPASAAEFKRQLLDVLNEITLDSSPALSPSLATHSPRRISWNAVLIGILILGLSFFGFYFFCKQEQSHDFKQTTETMSKRTGLLVAEASNFYKIGDYERSLSIYEQIIQANDKRSSKDEPNPLLATCLKDASRSASELYSRTGEKDTDLLWRSVHYSSRASRLFSAVPKYRIECIQQELIALSKLHEYDKVEQVIASMYRADDDIWARLGSIEAPVDTLVACKHYDSADKLCRNYLNQIAKLDDVEYPRLRLKLLRADIKFHRDEKLKGEAMNDAESVANTLTAEQHIAGAERTNLLERLRKLLLLSRTAFLMNFLEKEKKSNLPLYQATPGSDAKLFLALGEAASRLNKYELAKQYYKESLRRNKVATKAELTDLYCKNGLKEIEEKEKKGK